MDEILVGIFAILIGGIFCFQGFRAMRIIFPLWGFIAGFWLGAEIIHAITNDSFLSTTLSIVVGFGFALAGALLAYLFYAIAIVIFVGMVGYWLGAGLITLFGFETGVLSVTVGIALMLVFLAAAVIGNAPKYFVLFLTSFAGAGLAVSGALLVINIASLSDFDNGAFNVSMSYGWFWKLAVLTLGLVGYASQIVSTQEEELKWAQEWERIMSSNSPDKEIKEQGAQA